MAYASKTEVPVSKTQSEIKDLLMRAGAVKYMTLDDLHSSAIAFELRGRRIRFTLPHPDRRSEAIKYSGKNRSGMWVLRTGQQQNAAYEQDLRSRWRALWLCIKAKLEAIEREISTFEEEFLAHIITGNGKTIGERLLPELSSMSHTGPLLLQ